MIKCKINSIHVLIFTKIRNDCIDKLKNRIIYTLRKSCSYFISVLCWHDNLEIWNRVNRLYDYIKLKRKKIGNQRIISFHNFIIFSSLRILTILKIKLKNKILENQFKNLRLIISHNFNQASMFRDFPTKQNRAWISTSRLHSSRWFRRTVTVKY